MPVRHLVLWDIDGTLVDTRGVSGAAVADAFASVTGRRLTHNPELAGRTDRQIIAAALASHQLPARPGLFDEYCRALTAAARARQDELRTRGRALPGAAEVLAALRTLPAVVQTVVTGNIRPNAQLKLATFHLDRAIDFDVGGYGSDVGPRGALVGLARERAAARYATAFHPDRVVVVGDTPHDVDAARQNGVRAVGVATGPSTAADLRAAGADAVLDSLRDTEAAVHALLDVDRSSSCGYA
jgi:phosphoglycolate phosphatase